LIGDLAAKQALKPTFAQLREAVVKGSILASYTCEDFSTKSLESAKSDDLEARLLKFREYSGW